MDYVLLKHKTKEGYHAMISHTTLHRSGPKITPQLFPAYADKAWFERIITIYDKPYVSSVSSLDEFEIVKVRLVQVDEIDTRTMGE